MQFKLVRTLFNENGPNRNSVLIPWKQFASSALDSDVPRSAERHKISVEYRNGEITVMVNDRQTASIHDDRLPNGLAGLAVFGNGDVIFHDLLVQNLQ